MQSTVVDKSTVSEPVFVGALEGRSCYSGLEDRDVTPKLIINFYLSGGQSFAIDGVQFSESARDGRPRVSMINVRHHSRIHFDLIDSGRLRKVKASIPWSWLAHLEQQVGLSTSSSAIRRFLATHLAHFAFEPTPDLIELAEQISRPPPNLKGELLTLYRTARAIEMLRLAWGALAAQGETHDSRLSLVKARQGERVRNFILENLSKTLTIETIARACGASASSVQRYFKQQFGITVFEFIRRKRLEAARDALEGRGVTVAEAAWIAGYSSSSAFITAFKKTYGTCPGDMRS